MRSPHHGSPDVSTQVTAADSFAEIYWEDKIMPCINKAFADESIAKGGTAIAEEKIVRCMSDTSTEQPFINPTTGKVDDITNRTSYLMNSLLSHKSRRYGRWTFPRFQQDIGTSNFVAFDERNSEVMDTDPNAEPRQVDYDVWLGSDTLDHWIKWKQHGDANCLYLDGHVKSTNQAEAYLGMDPGGQLIKTPSFSP